MPGPTSLTWLMAVGPWSLPYSVSAFVGASKSPPCFFSHSSYAPGCDSSDAVGGGGAAGGGAPAGGVVGTKPGRVDGVGVNPGRTDGGGGAAGGGVPAGGGGAAGGGADAGGGAQMVSPFVVVPGSGAQIGFPFSSTLPFSGCQMGLPFSSYC